MQQERVVDVAVIGGGLIGLSSALHLIDTGMSVCIIDLGYPGRASSAAAGMLTPVCEYDPWMPKDFWNLLNEGLQYYPEFMQRFDYNGDSIGYRQSEFTLLDMVESRDRIMPRTKYMTELDIGHQWLSDMEVQNVEPNLSSNGHSGAIRIFDQAVVNPLLLHAEMLKSFSKFGDHVRGSVVTAEDNNGSFRLGLSDGSAVGCTQVVVAAGPWSQKIAASLGVQIPAITSVKGQMVECVGPPNLFDSVIFMPGGGCGSIVERAPGHYVVGTSEEYLHPDDTNTAGIIGAILGRLCRVAPIARSWKIERMWSGLRPMHADEIPTVGVALDGRVVILTGHHRNGVLLTPVSGKICEELLREGHASRPLELYDPARQTRRHSRFADKY